MDKIASMIASVRMELDATPPVVNVTVNLDGEASTVTPPAPKIDMDKTVWRNADAKILEPATRFQVNARVQQDSRGNSVNWPANMTGMESAVCTTVTVTQITPRAVIL
jgi:hypothetical protein